MVAVLVLVLGLLHLCTVRQSTYSDEPTEILLNVAIALRQIKVPISICHWISKQDVW